MSEDITKLSDVSRMLLPAAGCEPRGEGVPEHVRGDRRLNAGLAVGGTVALCGLFADPISGASMNPARSLGPALVRGKLDTIWIYIVGPLAGSLLAVCLTRLLLGPPNPKEERAPSPLRGRWRKKKEKEPDRGVRSRSSSTPKGARRHFA